MIDITTTATLRSGILSKTLKSFNMNLFKGGYAGLIVNIDPVGPDSMDDTIGACYGYFKIKAVRTPKTPSFPTAFKWAWQMADAEYVFHLEDDWILTRPVDLNKLIAILESDREIASVRLPAFSAGIGTMKNWNKIFTWNGMYYEPPAGEEWLGFCGHPSLLRGEFVRRCAPLLNPDLNPEKQFHSGNPALNDEFRKWKYVVYGEPADPPSPPLVIDIGRAWMDAWGYRKAGNKAWFTQWERENA